VARGWQRGGLGSTQHFIFMLIDSTLTAYKLAVVRVPRARQQMSGEKRGKGSAKGEGGSLCGCLPAFPPFPLYPS